MTISVLIRGSGILGRSSKGDDSMKRVLILGCSGMLGAMIADVFSCDPELLLTATVRGTELADICRTKLPSCRWVTFDAETGDIAQLLDENPCDVVINAIGIIKPYIKDDNPAQTERAVRVNALFPHVLSRACVERGCRVLQIATDCVYSGHDGNYTENALHDALDVYGKSKSLGEVLASGITHIRCSIIGPEPKAHVSLLDWFVRQPRGKGVNGFTNHLWNGVTTLHYAKACMGIVKEELELPRKVHLVPTGTVTKAEMLGCFARAYRREDIVVTSVEADTVIDRTLQTVFPEINQRIWRATGYPVPPTVPEMIEEMAAFDFRLSKLD